VKSTYRAVTRAAVKEVFANWCLSVDLPLITGTQCLVHEVEVSATQAENTHGGQRRREPAVIIKAAIQHRDRFIRTGLSHVLSQEPDVQVVAHVDSASDIVTAVKAHRPDVVLLELDAPWDGPRLAAALRKLQRTLRVVVLHDGVTPELARRAYQAGVRSSVDYSVGTPAIVSALRGRHIAAPVAALPTCRTSPSTTLTSREVEILECIAAGMLTREIAEHLGITLKTVENHKQRLFRKLNVQNQAHAVSIAIRQGVLAPAAIAQRA
jgi:DNA-binding NarL/FixJ family response regulator